MKRFLQEENGDVVQYILVLAAVVVILLFSFTRVKTMVKCTTERTVSAVASIFGSKNEYNHEQCVGSATDETDESGNGGSGTNDDNSGEIIIDGGGGNDNNTLPPGSNTDSSEINVTCQDSLSYYGFSIPKNVPPQGSGSHKITIKNKKNWDIWVKINSTSTENGLQITTDDPFYRKIAKGEEVVFKVGWKWDVKNPKEDERGNAKVYFSISCQEPPKEDLYVPNVAAPQNFKVTDVKDTVISLSWDKVNYASEYYLYRNDVLVYKGSSLSYVDQNILPGTTYTYKLFTSETTGTEVFATLQQKTTGISPIPPAPKSLIIYSITDKAFHINWDRSPKAVQYRILLNGKEVGSHIYSHVQSNLEPNTTYTIELIGENTYGSSEKATMYVTTNGISSLANPGNFRQSERTTTSHTMAWDPVPDATSYKLVYYGKVLYQGPNTSFTYSGLSPGNNGPYFLYALNGTTSSSGIYKSFGTLGTPKPTIPYNISITSVTNTSMKLSWTKGGYAKQTVIKINREEVYNDTGNSTIINNLTPNTYYKIEMYSENETGTGPTTTTTLFTTNDTYDDVSDLQATCQNESYTKKFTFPSPLKVEDGGTFIIDTTNHSNADLSIKFDKIIKKGNLFTDESMVKFEYDTSETKIKPGEKFSIPIRWFIDTKDASKVKDKTGEIEVVLTTSC